MAMTTFIPEVWNAQLLLDFRQAAIAAGLTNREYEGNLAAGNTVHINTGTAIGVTDYKAAGRTTSASAVSSTSIDLVVDQEKSFDFYVDDIDRAQAAGSMDAYTTSAGQGMAEDADKFILATAVAGAAAGNVIPAIAQISMTPADAFNTIRNMRKALNKAKVPAGDRVLLVNAEFEALLLDNDAKLTSVLTAGDSAGLRDAALGRLLNFDIYTTENLPVTATAQAMAFYKPSVAFVSQVQKTEAMRAQDKFADRLRGLHVYGAKVLRGGIGVSTFTAS